MRDPRRDAAEHFGIGKVDPRRIVARIPEQPHRQRDRRVRRAAHGSDFGRRIGEQRVVADIGIGELVDEAGVGAIFEQAADEIGEQVAVATDRRIGAALVALFTQQPFEQAFAHAVQPLEFEIAPILAKDVAGPFEDGGDGQRVVRRKGRIDVRRRQHVTRAGEIGNIGRRLAGEQRIIGQPGFLGALDLAVPIGALDQPHCQPLPGGRAQRVGPGDDGTGALAISLHRHAEAAPAGQRRVARHCRDDVEAHHQAFGFFGIDGQADAGNGGFMRQLPQHGGEFGHAGRGMGGFIARVQGGQFHRHRMAVGNRGGFRRLGGVADRGAVAGEIACAIGTGARRFAEHVEAGGEADIILVSRPGEGLVDAAAHDEHLPHHPHRGADGLPHERLAGTRDEALEDARFCPGIGVFAHQRAGDDQPPGGGIDQRRIAFAGVLRPIGGADLVADQRIGGFGIGNAQKGFGEAEQRDAFGGVEAILVEEAVDPAFALRGAQIGKQRQRAADDGVAGGGIERRGGQQAGQHRGFGGAVQGAHRGAGGGKSGSRIGHAIVHTPLSGEAEASARAPMSAPGVWPAHCT